MGTSVNTNAPSSTRLASGSSARARSCLSGDRPPRTTRPPARCPTPTPAPGAGAASRTGAPSTSRLSRRTSGR
eukprot:4702-Pelagococcus_subviridis.AAC.4